MYIYQAAAFRSMKQAEQFQAKIKALGYSAGIESASYGGDTWHRVLVHFKGSPQDTRKLKESLQELGVEKPLLRGKKSL
jgi:cell division protein FtsN